MTRGFRRRFSNGGFGIGLRPAAEVRRAVDAGTLEQVLPSYFLDRIPVWLVSPKGRQRVPRVMKVAEVLSKVVATLSE